MNCSAFATVLDNVWNGTSWLNAFANGQNVLIDANLELTNDLTLGHIFVSDAVTIEASNTITLTIEENAFFGDHSKVIGNVKWAGSAAQMICGATTFENSVLELDNSSGLTLKGGNVSLLGDLVLTDGIFSTQNALTLAAAVGAYSQIHEVNGSIVGNITFEQIISGANGWRHIASPVNTTVFDALEETNFYTLTSSGGSIQYWDASSGAWLPPASKNAVFDGAQPYNMYFGFFNPYTFSTLPHTLSLTGPARSGLVENAVVFGSATPSSNNQQGWNLIANPYPENLDWNSIRTNFGALNISSSYYVWDANISNYRVYNGSIGDPELYGTIAPGQSFFIKLEDKAAEATTAFDFTNANRTRSKASFYKTKPPHLVLEATQDHKTDRFYAAFEDGSSLGFDVATDGYKLFSPEVPQLYAEFGKEKLAINYMTLEEDTTRFILSYTNNLSGDALIEIDTLILDAAWIVEVEDKLMARWQNLKAGGYHFWHTPSNDANRFVVHIHKTGITAQENKPVVWASADEIQISLQQPMRVANIVIMNAAGQIVYETTILDLKTAAIPVRTQGFLVVTIMDENGRIFAEKVIK